MTSQGLGSKPDFHNSMKTLDAAELYSCFLNQLQEIYPKIKDGEFGAMMQVELINDGPVTIILDSQSKS